MNDSRIRRSSAGLDLHADVAVRTGDQRHLERLCRYVLRPPVAQDALELTAEGRVLLRLRCPAPLPP